MARVLVPAACDRHRSAAVLRACWCAAAVHAGGMEVIADITDARIQCLNRCLMIESTLGGQARNPRT
jgi:hypothetical protein